ncbi:MAG: MBL fold metallo-hydrolase [Hyphomicrobiales bacterium]|nr:MAG: MBL fold metallo-hydrolase [Hyphomicrobiales bacterium]
MASITFNRDFDPRHGEAVQLSPLIARVTANNPGPFTFHGTNTYLVGDKAVAVIDPGPDDPAHVDAILAAVGERPISHILVTHTHRDHSPAAMPLKEATGAPILAEGPHRSARPLHIGELNPLDASSDSDFAPDHVLEDGERIAGEGFTLEAVATPGHTANHMCFALVEEDALFTGDHVMAWSTSIVAPPDGAMIDFMESLEKLIVRADKRLFPAHGTSVDDPVPFLLGLKEHRLEREASILARLHAGDRQIPDMVRTIYADTDPRLHGAAGLSVLAHLEDLVAREIAATEGVPAINGSFWLKG